MLPPMQDEEKSLNEVIDDAMGVMAKVVVPLYQEDGRGRPSSYGSGFFIKAGEHHFLVSAAHVLETIKAKPLFYYSAPEIKRKLSGKLLLNPWQGDRKNDPIDIGVLRLSGEGLPPYHEVGKFSIDVSFLRHRCLPRSGKHYMIVGFPASQSHVNPALRQVAATAYGYRNCSIKEDEYCKHGLSPETHLALPLDLELCFDSNVKHRNFPRPQGMSGSPIWILYDEDGRDEPQVLPIVAVGTKYWRKERLLVGTDVAVVIKMINAAI